jgi:citryl-CoA lyase
MADSTWSTDVGGVAEGKIIVRGYALDEIIGTLTFAETVFLTIRGELPTNEQARVMDAVLCGIVEHGFFAPTSLALRVIASAAPESIMPALAGSMLTVGSVTVSPQHTGELIATGMRRVSEGASMEDAVAEAVDELVRKSRRMPGVGHPLHPDGDPRALALADVLRRNGLRTERSEFFEAVRDVFVERIERDLPINIDGGMGCALSELGFHPKAMPGIAAMSFMPGLIAHAVEETTGPFMLRVIRDGKYTGPPPRSLPPRA